MKACTPGNWSNRRLLIGALPLLAAGAAVYWWTESFIGVIAILTLWLLVDRLTAMSAIPAEALDLSIDRGNEAGEHYVGTTLQLTASITLPRTTTGLMIRPMIPPDAELIEPPAWCGTIRAGAAHSVTWTFRLHRAGVIVFPGVMLRTPSMFRLFTRTRLLTDPQAVTVLPDYATSTHPLLTRFIRPIRRAGALRQSVIRRTGIDLHEIREYIPGDARRDVDWKATARMSRLMVREREAPRDYAIRVILDGSLDMTHSPHPDRFTNVITFIARLAYVAMSQSMTFRLHLCTDGHHHQRRLQPGIAGYARLLNDLATISRRALVDHAHGISDRSRTEVARRAWREILVPAGARVLANDVNDLAGMYAPDRDAPLSRLLVDLAPDLLVNTPEHCPTCGHLRFADDATCDNCARPFASGGVPPRAAVLATVMADALRQTRDREMLLLISSLQGGECTPATADLLRYAATGHRTIHIVLPELEPLERMRPADPGTLGNVPQKPEIARNTIRLLQTARFRAWRDDLIKAGAHLHALDDASQLDEIVAGLLQAEVMLVR